VIPASCRERRLERLRARRARCRAQPCRYRAVEEAAIRGTLVDLVEADDAMRPAAAHAADPEPVADPARIYVAADLG
jgi:hypothetical protein